MINEALMYFLAGILIDVFIVVFFIWYSKPQAQEMPKPDNPFMKKEDIVITAISKLVKLKVIGKAEEEYLLSEYNKKIK